MLSTKRWAPVRFSLLILVAALLAACSSTQTLQPVASAVPVTGNNSAPSTAPTTAAQPAANSNETLTPAVTVSDQAVSNGTVTVASVTSPGPGWIVIHINNGGKPGEIIGWAPVNAGVNSNVQVTIDPSKVTPVLYAMLHVDAGKVGTYEFPGPDAPLMNAAGQMVSPPFAVTGGAGGAGAAAPTQAQQAAQPTATTASGGYNYGSPSATDTPASSGAAAATGSATVSVTKNAKLGNILVDSKGMTLYIFKKDTPGKSNCTGGCLENWPPLLITSGSPAGGAGVTGQLGQITRQDNGTQVTYNNQPLYYFAGDQAPGDVNGQGIGGSWFAATP